VDVGLLGGDFAGFHIHPDRVRQRPAEGNAQAFGDAVAVQRVIGAVERVGFIEEIRLAHGHRIDRADHDIDAVIAAEAEDAVERQVAIGAAEGPEKVERKGQVSRAPSAFAPPGSSRFPDRRIHRGW